jgi:hypothetical protein
MVANLVFTAKIPLGAIKISSNEFFFPLDVLKKFSSLSNFSSEFLGSVFGVFRYIVHSFHFRRKCVCVSVVKYEG